MILYEEAITRDLELLSDFPANQSSNHDDENYYDVQDLNALYFNELDWNLDLEHDLLSSEPKQSTTEALGEVPRTNGKFYASFTQIYSHFEHSVVLATKRLIVKYLMY